MRLIRSPNIADADGFYEALLAAQRELDDEQAERLLAKLVLILSNHVGDREVLDEALALARRSSLRRAPAA